VEGAELTCVDCGCRFDFSETEQQQFRVRGFAPPKRCLRCRAAKRRRQEKKRPVAVARTTVAIAPIASPRPRLPSELHEAVCTVCGAATQVPFLPDGVRPVYCLPCLKQRTR
jgi:CxxC-x17-CxxC domain-containing protein